MNTYTLPAPCESCDSTDTTQWTSGEMLCPACTAKYAMSYAAADHLRALLSKVAEQYVHTYAAFPHILKSADDEGAVIVEEEMQRAVAALQAAQQGQGQA